MLEPGLYIVSTPIGNLEDITLRALRVLKEADFVACEDTRHTGLLLHHYSIDARLISYHEHNKLRRTPELLEMLRQGKCIALASDAGTPGISDPGFYLIRAAIERGIRVIPIPGASALLAALVVSGLPSDHFVFEGFLPKRDGRKLKRLKALAGQERTIVIYESPHRVLKTLNQVLATLGERRVVVARELTKKFEEVIRGNLGDVAAALESRPLKGEVVIMIAGKADPEPTEPPETGDEEEALAGAD